MENWYAMKTMPEKEEEAAELIRRTIPLLCGNPVQSFRRKKLFRADGKLILSMEKMFPGYLFYKQTGSRMCQKC
ncbi:transcription termination/antitermination NusG family protein [Sellimonas intestinalis]|uniref:transcription termination/antitermination NusG family protein n=1 Tax=Sellimonas intestinalis TaxID=1653434 RepID=UPI00399AC4D1